MKITMGALAVGAGFGAVTSLVNALSSPYTGLGEPLVGTVWGKGSKVLSLLMDAGWAWAALAVALGWLAGTWARGALAGVLSLVAASVAYYVTDAFALGEPLSLFRLELVVWSTAAVLFGSALGAVGAAARRPGLPGLLAALVVPVGAAAQMVVMPPRPHVTMTTTIVVAETVVWCAAALGAGRAVHRFRSERRAAGAG
ncbi:hypothetical protein [Streptomyces sp. NPDC050504]|uniref:hypothetical protein n=1 Tax=Streptomyces sp. NPDC050504 TaxID=3365618 RepID=UPI0037A4156F